MTTASMSITTAASIAAISSTKEQGYSLSQQPCPSTKDLNARSRLGCSLSRSGSSKNSSGKDVVYAAGTRSELRRSSSNNRICYAASCVQASSTRKPKPKKNVSMGIFKFQIPDSLVPQSLRSLLINPLTKNDVEVEESVEEREEEEEEEDEEEDSDMDIEEELKRANWVERIMELQSQWRQKQQEDEGHGSQVDNEDFEEYGAEDSCCEVDYDEDGDHEGDTKIDGEKFSRLLGPVSWSDTKLFSKLAFLSNMAYAIPEIKAKDLKRCYGLDLVTSSLVKKAEAAAIKDKLDQDSTSLRMEPSATVNSGAEEMEQSGQKHLPRVFAAYEIAACAASYVQSKAKDLLALASEPQLEIHDDDAFTEAKLKHQEQEEETPLRVHKSEMAAYVAASTMTAVVAADEKQKQKAARDLQSLQSSPCEWFVCDDPSIYTRCFIIQGSDSLASWQTNLFFEPTVFEETDVLVHRGIYEAAKGIFERFMPEIRMHLERYGNRAKLQFAGHSLGGSLSLLVHLMILTRSVVEPSTLLPVVTFGSPFVFCGGQKVLKELGLNEDHVHCVMMHRDIVPRAFSCTYPNHVAQVLKRLNGTFRSHPCLNKNKMLYSPMGKIFFLQPDENSSPGHPLLPPGIGLYSLENTHCPTIASALRAFLNNPHPLETLSDLTAYGSEGTILRDHDSSNYLKAVNKVIRQQTRQVIKKAREHRNLLWPLLTTQSPHAWSHDRSLKEIMGA